MSKASKLIAEQPESPSQTRKVDHYELSVSVLVNNLPIFSLRQWL